MSGYIFVTVESVLILFVSFVFREYKRLRWSIIISGCIFMLILTFLYVDYIAPRSDADVSYAEEISDGDN